MDMEQVGFVGLGVMGGPMAGHLLRSGHSPVIWNRTVAKSEGLHAEGAAVAENLRELARDCSVIMLCVTRSEDVQACAREICENASPNTLIVDHSTISPPVALDLHRELRDRGLRFVDAPVTGGSMGAQNGTLTIFCGGATEDIERARPFMEAYGKRIERVGGPGQGQMVKMANQIAVGGALLALAEALAFAKKAGLDLEQTRSLLGSGAAGSWAFENYGPKIVRGDWSPGFSIANQRKDFRYCMEAADAIDISLPGVELVDGLLAILEEEGRGQEATVALFDLIANQGASTE